MDLIPYILMIPIALLFYFIGMWRKIDIYETEINALNNMVTFWRDRYDNKGKEAE